MGFGTDVFPALERGTRRVSHTDQGEMLIREYEEDSRMPRDGLGESCYTVVGVGAAVVVADVVGRGIDWWRVAQGIVVVGMHRVVDRMCPATSPGYQVARLGKGPLERAERTRLSRDYDHVYDRLPDVEHSNSDFRGDYSGSTRYEDLATAFHNRSHLLLR